VLGVALVSDETGPALSALGPPTLVGGKGEQRDEVLAGRDRREILLRVIVDIASDLDLDATLKRIVTGAMELTGARFGALGVRGPDDTLISFVHAGIDEVAVNTIGHHPVGKGVLGLLLSRSGSLRLDDLTAHPAAVGFPEHHPSMDALLAVPIIIRQNVFGSLYLTEPTSRAAFSDADETAVRELASAAAVAIDNARLFDRVRSTAQWTEASRMITTALLSAVDLHARLQLIAVRACELTEAEQAIVLVPSEADLPVDEVDILVVSTAVGLYADEVLGQWVPVEGSTTGAVFRSGTPVITAAFGHPPQAFTDAGRRPAIVMPLRSEHTVLGVIAVARNSDQPPFDAEHLDLMSDFADHAAMALTLASALEHARYLTVLADRERIGHDLHDQVIQRLFAAGLDLQGTIARSRSSEITDRLNRTVTDLQTTIEDIRTTIFELHSTGRRRIGFRQRIQAAVADLTENGAVVTTLRMSGPMSVIGDDLAGHAESVILEAVSNAVRHSGATQLTVEVAVADELDIMVTDDGCGISADNGRRSGLANMASRAEQIGGRCHLATPPGGGTEVHWSVPLPDL
jgi:two-component system, NarL family, sensor histidine kinase DevS